jgi:hypothetical protein
MHCMLDPDQLRRTHPMTTDDFNRDIFYTRMCGEEQALAEAIGKRLQQAGANVKVAAHWHWFQQPHHGDRARQVDAAMQAAAERALLALASRLPGLSLQAVWPVLRELCHDLALCLGGAALSDALVAAGLSTLDVAEGDARPLRAGAAGAPALPWRGADALAPGGCAGGDGRAPAILLRRFIGIDDIADAMRACLPVAVDAYQRGVAAAWGAVPDLRSADSADAPFFGADFQLGLSGVAARHRARGHDTVVMALLAALAAALRHDPAGAARLGAALRHSARLGPALASWLARHGPQLVAHALLQGPRVHACA